MAGEVHRASDWGPARHTPYAEVAARGRAGRGTMARAGGRDAPRGQCKPFGGEYLPALRPGPVGGPMAAPTRTGGCHHRALRRRFHRGLRTPGRRRTVLGRTSGTLGEV